MTQYKAKANVNVDKLIKQGELIDEKTYSKLPDWLKKRFIIQKETETKAKAEVEAKAEKKDEKKTDEKADDKHVTDNPDRQFMNKGKK